MKKIIYSLGVLVLFILAFAGCSKDFLEIAPVGQLTSDNFLKNDNDVKLATMGFIIRSRKITQKDHGPASIL